MSRPLAARRREPGSCTIPDTLLTRIRVLAGRVASLELRRYRLEVGVELPAAVEGSHDHVPALTALRVIPVWRTT